MNIHDIRDLANILMQAQPGAINDPVVQATWRAIVGDVAGEIRKRSKDPELQLGLVLDHRFDEAVFVDVVMGKGTYDLSDPEENDRSWEMARDEAVADDAPFWRSAVVLGEDA